MLTVVERWVICVKQASFNKICKGHLTECTNYINNPPISKRSNRRGEGVGDGEEWEVTSPPSPNVEQLARPVLINSGWVYQD